MEIVAEVLGGLFTVVSIATAVLGVKLKKWRELARETQELYTTVVAALEDNKLTKKEVVQVTRQAYDVVDALEELVQRISTPRKTGKKTTVYCSKL